MIGLAIGCAQIAAAAIKQQLNEIGLEMM